MFCGYFWKVKFIKMRLFYAQNIDSKELSSEESQHAIKVLRLKIGDKITLINGKGTSAEAEITFIDKRNCRYKILQENEHKNPLENLHLAVAPTKSNDRLEWMLEKVTEIGIGNIHLIHTKRSEKTRLNLERLEKKMISAIKQSQKFFTPNLLEYNSLKDFFTKNKFEQKFIAHLADEDKKYLGKELNPNQSSCVLIGPEGDFTDDEIKLALSNGYQPVTLGNYRLRTETAGVFATTLMNDVNLRTAP
jgi:16S rRNA (uracil1498-N3)-methyltransferase